MAKNENAKSKAEIYREERKERLAKAAKKNAKNALMQLWQKSFTNTIIKKQITGLL